MPINRPHHQELVTAVREMLEEQFVPHLEDKALLYQCRVSINILKIVERELSQGEALETAEQQRLSALLGEDGDLDQLNTDLIRRIRAGDFDEERTELMAHLLHTTLDKIAIDNPGYSTYRQYREQGHFNND